MKIIAYGCSHCHSYIYSRAPHDFRYCLCKAIAVDGGQTGYVRLVGEKESFMETTKEFDLGETVTLKDLYTDWSLSKDKFGLVKET